MSGARWRSRSRSRQQRDRSNEVPAKLPPSELVGSRWGFLNFFCRCSWLAPSASVFRLPYSISNLLSYSIVRWTTTANVRMSNAHGELTTRGTLEKDMGGMPYGGFVWPDAAAVLLHVRGGSGVFLKRRRRLPPPMTHSCGVVRGGRPFAKELIQASRIGRTLPSRQPSRTPAAMGT